MARGMGPKHTKQSSGKNREKVQKNISYDKLKKKYYVTFYYGVDPNTKKPVKKTGSFDRKKDAEAALKKFNEQKSTRSIVAPSNETLVAYTKKLIEAKEIAGREAATIADYNKCLKQIEDYDYFKKTKIQDISSSDIRKYLVHLKNVKKYSNNTIRKHLTFLKGVFKLACSDDVILKNPVGSVEMPKKVETCRKFQDRDDVIRILKAAKGTKYECFIAILYLGLRREEIAGLRWENVDFKNRVIRIKEVRLRVNGEIETKNPKTDSSERQVYIHDYLYELLENTKNEQRKYNPTIKNMNNMYVIAKKDGSAYSPNYLDTILDTFLKDNGLPHFRMHDFRHTVATLSNAAGNTLYDTSKLLGHSSTRTTGDIYTHQFSSTNEKAITSILGFLEDD